MWEPRFLTTLWAFTVCYRQSFPFFFFYLLLLLDRFKTDLTEEILSRETKLATVVSWTELEYIILGYFDETPRI
jgi:hypothetical protein